MRIRRSRLEIFLNILKAVSKERLTITHILYRSNLSYAQARLYVNSLVQQGLINKVEQEGTTTYSATEEGKKVLEHFEAISEKVRLR